MSPKLFSGPVLLLASNSIGKLGTLDADNLCCIWTVFTKCGENLENGRRLENLSWRLWYRTTHFCNEDSSFCTYKTNNHSHASSEFSKDKGFDVPELSSSVDSASSLDEHEIKRKIPNYDSSKMHVLVQESSKKPKTIQYVSPGRFQKIIMDLTPFKIITEKWKNVHNATCSTLHQHEHCMYDSPKDSKQLSISPNDSQSIYSNQNSVSSNAYSSCHLNTELQTPNKYSKPAENTHVNDTLNFHVNMPSSETFVQHNFIKTTKPPEKTDKMFFIQETLPSESFIEDVSKNNSKSNTLKSSRQSVKSKPIKHISFQKSTNTCISEVSDNEQSECGDTNNSADDDDWDSVYDSSFSSTNEKHLFQRINTHLPKPQLHSRRSLLSLILQNKSNGNLTNSGSKSSPAIALSQASVSSTISKQVTHQQTAATHVSNVCSPVISPRTIRRNMFATELSESLRKNLLWERQQRAITTFGTLKYRHTTDDVTKLSGSSSQLSKENHNFFDDRDYSYHAAGW